MRVTYTLPPLRVIKFRVLDHDANYAEIFTLNIICLQLHNYVLLNVA